MPAPPSLDAQVDSLTARLALTEQQQESVRSALSVRSEALRAARGLPTRRERREAMERAQTEADSRIAASLTSAQRATYAEIRAERPVARDPQMERQLSLLRDELDLSAEQETAIAAILEKQTDEIEALIAGYQRTGGQEIPEVREEIQAIRERTDELIIAELTEQQADTYRRLRSDQQRPGRRRTRG